MNVTFDGEATSIRREEADVHVRGVTSRARRNIRYCTCKRITRWVTRIDRPLVDALRTRHHPSPPVLDLQKDLNLVDRR
jgi:hypothetical protein